MMVAIGNGKGVLHGRIAGCRGLMYGRHETLIARFVCPCVPVAELQLIWDNLIRQCLIIYFGTVERTIPPQDS